MKLSNVLIGVVALTTGIDAVATPRAADLVAIDARAPEAVHPEHARNEELWKRKGGGGGGGRGGSGSGRGGGGSSGGSGGGSRGGGGSSGRGGASDNTGGRTTTGTGPQPAYRGYYPGGAAVPYRAGSTISGIAPALLGGVALATIAFGTYHFINGAYAYPYTHPYYYHNATTNMNETKPVTCLCDPYNPCACEDNGDQTYFNSVIGNGTSAGLNQSIVAVAKNETTGNETIYINGGLPNGTTAAGGTDVPDSMAAGIKTLAQAAGWWPVATVAFSLAFLL